MSCCRCCRSDYKFIAVLLAIAVGIIVGFVYSLGLFTGIAGIWIMFGIAAALGLAVFLYVLFGRRGQKDNDNLACVCRYLVGLIVGIVGTIVLATIALSITLVITTVVAVIIGLLAFFFALALIFAILLALCFAESACCDHRDDDVCCCCNENNHHFY